MADGFETLNVQHIGRLITLEARGSVQRRHPALDFLLSSWIWMLRYNLGMKVFMQHSADSTLAKDSIPIPKMSPDTLDTPFTSFILARTFTVGVVSTAYSVRFLA